MTAPAQAAPMREDVIDAIVRELNVREMLNASPATLDRLQAERIYRAVLAHTARPDAGDEDVERVARAIAEKMELTAKGGEQIISTEDLREAETDIGHIDLFEVARAALAAMREGVDRGMVERAKDDLASRKAVNEIIAGLIRRHVPDFAERVRIGNEATTAILRALDTEQPR